MNIDWSIENNQKLIMKIAHSLYKDNRLFSIEDLFQIGYLCFLKLEKQFDESKSKKSTYVTICVRREMIAFIKRHNKIFSERREKQKAVSFPPDAWECLPDLDAEESAMVEMILSGYSKAEIAKRFHLTKSEFQKRLDLIGKRLDA